MSSTRVLPRWSAAGAIVVLLVPLGACSVLGLGGVSISHRDLEGEWSDAGVPGSVSEVAWEWTAEGYSGDVEVAALSRGVLVRMSDGVVALDGVTGEERWSFTVEDEDVRALTDVSSSGERVHVLYPKDVPEEEAEVAGDAEEGLPAEVEWRRVVLDGVSGEIVGDLEEPIAPDVEKPGPFNVGVAGDGGVFHLEGSDRLSGAMLSEEDGAELWRTEDLFTCDGSKVNGADRPVVFSGAVVVKAGCDSGEAEMVALDPVGGAVLWHLEGDETEFLTPDKRSVRGAGELLPVYHDRGPMYEDERFSEMYVLDPVTGEVVGDVAGIEEEGLYLARTVEDGFLVSQRTPRDDAAGYELRRFDGQTLATGERAVRTASAGSYVLALEGAVVKLEPEDPETPVSVTPWDGGEPHRIELPEPVKAAGYFQARQPEGQFEAVPGAVVLVDRSDSQGEGVKVIGFR